MAPPSYSVLAIDTTRSGPRNELYRGTGRTGPWHCDVVPDDDPVNVAFFRYVEGLVDDTVISDLRLARYVRDEYNRFYDAHLFEIIEIAEPVNRSVGGTRLGFDVSYGGSNSHVADAFAVRPLLPALARLARFLNRHMLFDDPNTAEELLELTRRRPVHFEVGDYEVVAIYLVV